MIATINPSAVSGAVIVPASKSVMQRACALALLHNGKTWIHNPGKSSDDLAAINIIRDLGATLSMENEDLVVQSNGVINNCGEINCGESGLSLRMFAPVAALGDNLVLLKGEGSLLKRPMHFMDEIFPLLGVEVGSNNGFLPIRIRGPLIPTNISIDGSQSSQYLTGLLFAFAKATKKQVTLNVSNLKSKPYIELSLQMLKHFGYRLRHDGYEVFYIDPVELQGQEIHCHIEADWSAASFLLVAGAISGSITVAGLNNDSVQADKSIMVVLEGCGADIGVSNGSITVKKTSHLKAFDFDATDCPDLFPPLVALAANCNGVSVIKGISRLAGKESNRAETLMEVFNKMGVEVFLKDDAMVIKGGSGINAAAVSSHQDHRIAMACAVAALNARGPVIIDHAEAVNKSYPDFYNHLIMLGASVSLSRK
jgi:3-phosphoshikimate 1-carboxyvinyltransferase